MRNSRGLNFLILLAAGIFGFSLLGCGGGEVESANSAYIEGSSFANGYSTATLRVEVTNAGGTPVADGTLVNWTVEWARNNSPVMRDGWETKKTGLAWGSIPKAVNGANYDDELTSDNTSVTAGGVATMKLTDIIGEREISIRATAIVGGAGHSVDQLVHFGEGPLAKFSKIDNTAESWREAYRFCDGNGLYPVYPDDPAGWIPFYDAGAYRGGRLPRKEELKAVSLYNAVYNPVISARGAALTAGWLEFGDYWWSGVASDTNEAFDIQITSGQDNVSSVSNVRLKACRR